MDIEYQYHDESYFKGRFDNIVSVQGFGWTGSTAVCDLISEFSGWTVYSGTLPSSNNKGSNYDNYEVQLFHDFNLMELRDSCKVYDTDDLFDFRIKRLLINYFELILDDETSFWIGSPYYKTIQFKVCLAGFLFRILDLTDSDKEYIINNLNKIFFPVTLYTTSKEGKIDHKDPFSFSKFYFNSSHPKLSFIKDGGYIFYKRSKKLRRQGLSEIDSAIREFLYNYFEITSKGNRNICYSQLFGWYYIDDENKPNFIPKEFKHIYVYRDPRDSYFSNIKRCMDFTSVDYKIKHRVSLNLWGRYYSGNNRLLLKFENLVNDYENQLTRIYRFLGIEKQIHVNKLTHFLPDKSKKSIGSYKNFHDQDIMEKIRLANPQFYFDEPEDWDNPEKYK